MATDAVVVLLPAGGGPLVLQDVRLPNPGAYEVVVRQNAAGVCHSQLGHIASADPSRSLLLGHESFGVVEAVGDMVGHVVPGDEVFVTWIPRSAERRPAPTTVFMPYGEPITLRNVFTWGSHSIVDEQFVVKAPAGLPADVAAIIGCAVMTGGGAVINSAALKAGETAAVWGVGGVGLVAVAAARRAGAAQVIAVDVDDAKLDLARRMGADHVVNALRVDPVETIRNLTATGNGGSGVDYSFDCTGRVDNIPKSLAAVRPGRPGDHQGGAAVLVSVIRGPIEISGPELLNGQKRLIGCLGGASVPGRDFEQYVEWYRAGDLDLDALITDRYPMSDVNAALEDLRHGKILGRAVLEM